MTAQIGDNDNGLPTCVFFSLWNMHRFKQLCGCAILRNRKEEPAVQTEEKTEAAKSGANQKSKRRKEVKPAETVLEPRESEEQLLARQKKIKELIEQAEVQLYGEGVPVDLSKAAVLYGQAADLGSPKAMMRLSALYRKRYRCRTISGKSF